MPNNAKLEALIVTLADDLAGAARDFSSHGYSQMIDARETFKISLGRLLDAQCQECIEDAIGRACRRQSGTILKIT